MARFTLPRDIYHGKGSLEALKTFKLVMTPDVATNLPHETVAFVLSVECSEAASFIFGFLFLYFSWNSCT